DSEAERSRQVGKLAELLEDRALELAPRLVAGQLDVAVRRRLERVPPHEDGLGPLPVPELEQEVPEADEGIRRPAVAAERLRDRVIRAVGEGVAVDGQQQHPAHTDASSSAIAAMTRSVAVR